MINDKQISKYKSAENIRNKLFAQINKLIQEAENEIEAATRK